MGLTKKTVVIMDDAAGTRKLVAYLLAEAGHEAVACGTSEDTLAAVKEHSPDLVLLDVQMPGAAGESVAHILRKSFPEVKVVYLSNYAPSVLQELAERTGAHGFVQKSGDIDEMLEAISGYLDDDEAPAEA
ncbi:MAG: response regulator transcription factor [Deltaproteobacteria bacterium]|nr:response regulator transcription factor [Deltaproteobacteria bacterium]